MRVDVTAEVTGRDPVVTWGAHRDPDSGPHCTAQGREEAPALYPRQYRA